VSANTIELPMFYTDACIVVYNEFVVKSCVWDLHCIYCKHISKDDCFLPGVCYVKVKTCMEHVILIDMGIKKLFLFGKITLAGLCSLFSPTMAGFTNGR